MAGIAIQQLPSLDVIEMEIRYELRRTEHISYVANEAYSVF